MLSAAGPQYRVSQAQLMIQRDWDAINQLIEVVKELKGYTNALGQIEVVVTS